MLGLCYTAALGVSILYIGWTPALGAIMEELSLSYEQAGLLAAVIGVGGGIVLPFAGLLADSRFGAKNVVLVALVIGAVGQILLAIADTFATALLSRILCGVAVGLLIGGCYPLAYKWFQDSKRYGLASGILLTTDGVGALLALYVFAFVLTAFGWRGGTWLSNIFLLAVFIAALFFLKDAPSASVDAEPGDRGVAAPRNSMLAAARGALSRNLLVAVAFTIGEWGLFALVASWVPTILIDAGFSVELAGLSASLTSVAGILSAVVLGLFVDKVQRKKLVLVYCGVAVTLCSLVLTAAVATENYTLVLAILPVLGLASYATIPVSMSMAVAAAGAENSGMVSGLIFGGGFLVGGFAYPYVMGYIKDDTGEFFLGFLLMTVVTFLLCVVSAFFARDIPSVDDQAERRDSLDLVAASQHERVDPESV